MKKLLAIATLTIGGAPLFGQLTVNTNITPQSLVEDVLVGNCVSVSNITYNGSANPPATGIGRGSFTSTTNLGLATGVILATGNANVAGQAASAFSGNSNGTGSDADLVQLSGQTINDRSVLEFDFVPEGDSISFRFVFASEEYPEFVCSTFNDAFGFFLSGPGISGPFSNNAINIALVPGTTVPITINTINSGVPGTSGSGAATCAAADPNWQANSVYYVDNTAGTNVIYDGFTTVLTARAEVQCNQTYHIKLAIGDGSDSGYDSAVFLEGGSFSSVPFVPELTPAPSIVGNTILESCLPLQFDFIRTSCDVNTSEEVYISYGGTAINGVDIVPALPETLAFAPGESVIVVPFQAPVDADGPEDFILNLQSIDCNGNMVTNTFTFIIDELPQLQATGGTLSLACGDSVLLAPTVSGGFGQYTYAWSTGGDTPTIMVSPTSPTVVELVVTDLCDVTATATFDLSLTPPPGLNMSIVGPNTLTEGCDIGTVNIIRPAGSSGDLTVTLTSGGTATNNEDHIVPPTWTIPDGVLNNQFQVPTLVDALAEGNETVIITASYTNACAQTVTASVTFTIEDVGTLSVALSNIMAECSEDTALVAANVSGGVAPFNFEWSTGETAAGIWVPLLDDGTYTVMVTDDCGRTATATAQVIIDCDVIIPNVFTPNNDGTNDRWVIDGLGRRGNTVRVFNRWGQLLLDAVNYANNWAATDIPDGTYFYEVYVESRNETHTGHLTILRKY